jgi:hypothetical protein
MRLAFANVFRLWRVQGMDIRLALTLILRQQAPGKA